VVVEEVLVAASNASLLLVGALPRVMLKLKANNATVG
jgi:hypothetical protein